MISWTSSLLEYHNQLEQCPDESVDRILRVAHEAEYECKQICRFLYDLLVDKDTTDEIEEQFLDDMQEYALELEIALYRLDGHYTKQGREIFQDHIINFVRLINNHASNYLQE